MECSGTSKVQGVLKGHQCSHGFLIRPQLCLPTKDAGLEGYVRWESFAALEVSPLIFFSVLGPRPETSQSICIVLKKADKEGGRIKGIDSCHKILF